MGLSHKPACRLPVNFHRRHLRSPKADLFYHPTGGRRLSRPWWVATYRDGLPARRRPSIQVLNGPDVYVDRDQRVTAKPRHHLMWTKKVAYWVQSDSKDPSSPPPCRSSQITLGPMIFVASRVSPFGHFVPTRVLYRISQVLCYPCRVAMRKHIYNYAGLAVAVIFFHV